MSEHVRGFDFNSAFRFDTLFSSFGTTGFQATHLHRAAQIMRIMKTERERPLPKEDIDESGYAPARSCTIFLGYTSNMVSSGNREVIRYLVEHNLVDVLVTTAGGIEEDLIKCLGHTKIANFRMDDAKLREEGVNRIGNLTISSENYSKFEDWITPIFTNMMKEQEEGKIWTPCSFIHHLGEKINNEESIYYWASINNIPVFCPAITDGSIGDMLYFFSIKTPGLILDISSDLSRINNIAKFSEKTGIVILGGGLVKHHICNANLMRNGADFSVFINTACEYDGSDSGADPSEAVSWGKIKPSALAVKVFCDATIAFPLLVAYVYRDLSNSSNNNVDS